ncbi:MAG: hypothetical protein ACYC67_25310 [Prosthecobacter sp.]|jgi:hypothetical protein
MKKIIHWCEYLGGATDEPPCGFPQGLSWLILGAWWALLVVLIVTCCGQSSKFIYIDF